MSKEPTQAVVLQDSAGALYVIPQETIDAARVPDDAIPTVTEDLSEVTGFSMTKMAPVAPNQFGFVGVVTPSTTRVQTKYAGMPWPCDMPANIANPGQPHIK